MADFQKIGAFYLKPKDFLTLSDFKVEIWFSLTNSYCLDRIKELCENKGMVKIDKDDSDVFVEASTDKSSTSCFELTYEQNINGWYMEPSGTTDLMIETNKVNFHNYFTDMKELYCHEELSLFPPRFTLHVKNQEHRCVTDLNKHDCYFV